MNPLWEPDRLLAGYESLTIPLPGAEKVQGDPEYPLAATLVRRNAPQSTRAVLYIHGWNDYFFQTHVADWCAHLGYDFYALDLRRYGRNLHAGQLAGYITNLDDYEVELDHAVSHISASHDEIVLTGHSTGGLIAAMYADRRPGRFSGLVLNSPWIDLQASDAIRVLGAPVVKTVGAVSPTSVLPRGGPDFYYRTIHSSFDGEWDYDLELKRPEGFPVRVGWLAAVLEGHARVASGMMIDCPVLVLLAARSGVPRKYRPSAHEKDIVLDVERLAAASHNLGWHVSIVRIEDGIHDLTLSKPRVRTRVGVEVKRWMFGYLRH